MYLWEGCVWRTEGRQAMEGRGKPLAERRGVRSLSLEGEGGQVGKPKKKGKERKKDGGGIAQGHASFNYGRGFTANQRGVPRRGW